MSKRNTHVQATPTFHLLPSQVETLLSLPPIQRGIVLSSAFSFFYGFESEHGLFVKHGKEYCADPFISSELDSEDEFLTLVRLGAGFAKAIKSASTMSE